MANCYLSISVVRFAFMYQDVDIVGGGPQNVQTYKNGVRGPRCLGRRAEQSGALVTAAMEMGPPDPQLIH